MSEYTSKQFRALIKDIQNKKAPYHKRPATVDLQNILIDSNPLLSSKHVLILTEALDRNSNISTLNLQGVKISYPATEILKKHIKSNYHLHDIQVACMFTNRGKEKLEFDINHLVEKNTQAVNAMCENDFLLANKKNGFLTRSLQGLQEDLITIKNRYQLFKNQKENLTSVFSRVVASFSDKVKQAQKKSLAELERDLQFISQLITIATLLLENKEKQTQLERVHIYQQNINEIIWQSSENFKNYYTLPDNCLDSNNGSSDSISSAT